MNTYRWFPVESSFSNHIVEVVEGNYFTKNNSVSIAREITLNTGWGKRGSEYVIGDLEKEVPREIDIIWFSYSENKFYRLQSAIKELNQLFETGIPNNYNGNYEKIEYVCFGMAPGGLSNIWLQSRQQSKLVQTFNGQEIDYNWEEFLDVAGTREEYIEYLKEDYKINSKFIYRLEDIEKIHQPYQSTFEFITKATPDLFEVEYFNGESFQYKLEDLKLQLDKTSLPKKITLTYQAASPTKTLYIYFDKDELVDFVKNNQGQLTYRFYFNIYNNALKIEIYSKDGDMELTQFDYEIYK